MVNFSTLSNLRTPRGEVQSILLNGNEIWTSVKRYGFKREKANSDPAARITYLYDAEGMAPMSVDLTTGEPDYGDWKSFIDELCRPVMLKYDGTVDYELDHDDQTLRIDGSTSDITNDSYAGDAMVEFRKYKWVKRYEDDTYEYVIFCNIQLDETYHAYAHTNIDNQVANMFYIGMFKGSHYNSAIRSLAKKTLATGLTTAQEQTYAQTNNNKYDIVSKSQRDYISDILTMLSKNDSSEVYGYGVIATSNPIQTGSLVNKKDFYGSSNQATDVKTLWIEGFWGNTGERMTGLLYHPSKGGFLVKMTPPYNLDGTGYLQTNIAMTGTSGEYIKTSTCSDAYGWLPKTTGGSMTTYVGDGAYYSSGSTIGYPRMGGTFASGRLAGMRLMVANAASTHAGNYGCPRLSFVPTETDSYHATWTCDGTLPSTNKLEYPIGTGKVFVENDYGTAVRLYSSAANNQTGAALRLANYGLRMGQQATLEVEICIASTQDNTGGLRFILGESIDGSISGRGLKVVINKNTTTNTHNVHVLSANETISTQKNNAEISLLTWHTLKLELDTINNSNKVYLNGTLISTQTNDELSVQDANTVIAQAYHGSCWVRAFRYSKIV